MQVHDNGNQVQTDASSGDTGSIATAVKPLEYVFAISCGNPHPVIPNLDEQAAPLGSGDDLYRTACGRVLDRV